MVRDLPGQQGSTGIFIERNIAHKRSAGSILNGHLMGLNRRNKQFCLKICSEKPAEGERGRDVYDDDDARHDGDDDDWEDRQY